MNATCVPRIKTLPAPAPHGNGGYVKLQDLTPAQMQQARSSFAAGTLENHLYLINNGDVIGRKHAGHFSFEDLLHVGAL